MSLLHTFNPNPILITLGPIKIYWYGLFIVLGVLLAIITALKLASYYKIPKNKIIDLSFWLIIFGILGARLYHVLLELPYYLHNPLDIIKIWQGGLAIHGAIIAGLITVWFFSKKESINFWLVSSLIVPGLALAMAIGRWGNYFNQELFGLPTDLPWGIPINLLNRPLEYISTEFFHPTFLYESLGSLLIFIILILFHAWIIKNKKPVYNNFLLLTSYFLLYSFLRFSLEFIRIDTTPEFLSLRWPQIASLIIILLSIILILFRKKLPFSKTPDSI